MNDEVEKFIEGYKKLCENTGVSLDFNAFGVNRHALKIGPYGALIRIVIEREKILIRPPEESNVKFE